MNKENCCKEMNLNVCCPEGTNHENTDSCCTETQVDCCETANSNCCDPRQSKSEDINEEKIAKITIDGIELDVSDPSKNLVDIAKEVNISIPAPCYHAKRKNGCCKACVVEADGEQTYACATKPRDGMKITVNREDLNDLRKESLLAYKKNLENDTPMKCECS